MDDFKGHVDNKFNEAVAEIGKTIKRFDDPKNSDESCDTIAFLFDYVFDGLSNELLIQIACDIDSMLNGRGLQADFDGYGIIGYEPIGSMDDLDDEEDESIETSVDYAKNRKKEENKRKKQEKKEAKKFRGLTISRLHKYTKGLLKPIRNDNQGNSKNIQKPPPT